MLWENQQAGQPGEHWLLHPCACKGPGHAGLEGTSRGHLVHPPAAAAVLKPQRDGTCPFSPWHKPQGSDLAPLPPPLVPSDERDSCRARLGPPFLCCQMPGQSCLRYFLICVEPQGKSEEGLVPLRGSAPEPERPACGRGWGGCWQGLGSTDGGVVGCAGQGSEAGQSFPLSVRWQEEQRAHFSPES